MKKYRIILVLILFALLTGFYSLMSEVNTAQAATRTTANSNLTSPGNVRNFLRTTANRGGYISYYKTSPGPTLLYHPNAGTGWNIRTYQTSGSLTRSNDGSNDQRNQCVDINNSGFRFDVDIWANRGDGCGSNGTTTSYYVGGRVVFDPPNDVPVFIWVRDIDGLDGRQHITFTSDAIDDIYIPNSNRSFDVEGGDDLVSNGGFCSTETDGKCNAIVLLRANTFAIRAGMRDGNSRISVENGALAQYRTLVLNPNGGTVVESATPPASVLWSHPDTSDPTNLLREYEQGATASGYPTPTRNNYEFQGWYDAITGGNRITSRPMSNDITLYARWAVLPPPTAVRPNATLNPNDTIANGDTFVAGASIVNNSTTATANVTIDSRQIWYDFDNSGCFSYRYEPACGDVAVALPSGTQSSGSVTIAPGGVYDLGNTSPITANIPAGASRVCTRFDITGTGGTLVQSGATTATSGSAYACTPVAKYPALQVLNGDVRVGGNFTSGVSCTLPITYTLNSGVDGNDDSILGVLMHNYGASSGSRGSFGSYAATAPGVIKRYGSSGFMYNNPSATAAMKNLLFGSERASSYASGANGFFHVSADSDDLSSDTPTYCLPDLPSTYSRPAATTLATPLQDAVTNTSGNRRYVFNGTNQTLNIPATTLTAGQRTYIWVENNPITPNPVNTVRITGNITPLTTSLNSVTNIPQLVLIVNGNIDIKINENVAEIYGVYSTGGNIYTCGDFDGRSAMTETNCVSPLRVSGALITNQRVLPYRTAGYTSATDGTYAETFNLHPGVLVSDYMRARSNSSTFVTDYQQELPTRL